MADDMPAPFEASLLLTSGCNLHCPFCYERAWRSPAGTEFTPAQWLAVLRELSELQVLRVRLLGGEPLCSPAFEPLLREIPRTKMRFSVISNGTLWDEKKICLTAESGRCDRVQISLDGMEEVHDRLRGRGAFARAVQAVKELASAEIKVKVNAVLMRSTLPGLGEFLNFLEELPIDSCRLNPVGGNCGAGERLSLEELASAGEYLFSREGELKKPGKTSFPFVLRKLYRTAESDDDEGGGCFRSRIQINIHADGAVTPCPDLREPVCGYALREPLREIWEGEELNRFRKLGRKETKLPWAECGECECRAVCRRYCPLSEPAEMCLKKLCDLWRGRGIAL